MSKIKSIISRQIIDSRGNPTIETEVFTENHMGRFSVPSGASTGIHEALELRDLENKNYMGKGVLKAVSNVNNIIAERIIGLDVFDQNKIDEIMIDLDGTDNKSNLGANSILSVSMAVAKVASLEKKIPIYKYLSSFFDINEFKLPVPMMNILNGGSHADNLIDIQEFMIMPVGFNNFSDALKSGVEIFHCLKKLLKQKKYLTNVGDEGGFAPNLNSNEEALDFVLQAIDLSGYKIGEDIFLSLDVAASELYDSKTNSYIFKSNNKTFSTDEIINYWDKLVSDYPIISIEDPLHEDDWSGWSILTKKIGNKVQIVGDDLFVTNSKRLSYGIKNKCANSILLKFNQVGSLSETIETIKLAKSSGYSTIISHRSGETEETVIADMSVAFNLGQIKTGSLCRTDRVCKYNQLIRISEEINDSSYFGAKILKR